MQRLVLTILALFFAITVLGASIVQRMQSQVHAQAGILSLSPSPSPMTRIEDLMHPGWLPTHPLYPIKMIQDRVYLLMQKTPVEKVEQRLLYADRRMESGVVLIGKGEFDIGITTFFKGVAYLDEAVHGLESVEGDTTELKSRVGEAAVRYEHFMIEVKPLVPELARPAIDTLIERVILVKNKMGVVTKETEPVIETILEEAPRM